MVQVLPAVPSFGEKLSEALTRAGVSIGEGLQKRNAGNALSGLVKQFSGTSNDQGNIGQGGVDLGELDPLQKVKLYNAAESYLGKDQAKVLIDAQMQKEKINSRRSERYEKENVPELKKVADNLNNLELEQARFDRMKVLSDSGKLPASWAASLALNDEGQIRPVFANLLSPEAQEFTKLIVDNLTSAKDTFGARLTNFDVKTYLQKLPSLINTPEGRDRVIRDLSIINKLNQVRDRAILETFEEHGGAGSISYDKAQRIAEKKYRKEFDELKKEFVSPSKEKFKELPNPVKMQGEKIRNDETGEVFISDGKGWKPYSEEPNQNPSQSEQAAPQQPQKASSTPWWKNPNSIFG
jgi:hypothetical protein